MVVLKKIRGTTLFENLVAMVLVILIFLLVSSLAQFLFQKSIQTDEHAIKVKFDREYYFVKNLKMELPEDQDYKNWRLEYKTELIEGNRFLVLEATAKTNQKKLLFKHVMEN